MKICFNVVFGQYGALSNMAQQFCKAKCFPNLDEYLDELFPKQAVNFNKKKNTFTI